MNLFERAKKINEEFQKTRNDTLKTFFEIKEIDQFYQNYYPTDEEHEVVHELSKNCDKRCLIQTIQTGIFIPLIYQFKKWPKFMIISFGGLFYHYFYKIQNIFIEEHRKNNAKLVKFNTPLSKKIIEM